MGVGVRVRLGPVEVVTLLVEVEAMLDRGCRTEVGGRCVLRQRVGFVVDTDATHGGSVVTHAWNL